MEERTWRDRARVLVKNKYFELFILILIVAYTLMIFVMFAVEEEAKKNNDLQKVLDALIYSEIVILTIFVVEISIKTFAFGVKVIKYS